MGVTVGPSVAPVEVPMRACAVVLGQKSSVCTPLHTLGYRAMSMPTIWQAQGTTNHPFLKGHIS